MPFALPAADTTAALHAALAHSPDVKMCQGWDDDGPEWLTLTWPARQFIIHQDAAGAWIAHNVGQLNASRTGATPAEALRAALAHA